MAIVAQFLSDLASAAHAPRSNYAFNPIAEQALRSNQNIVPQRVNAALDRVSHLRQIWNFLGHCIDGEEACT